MPSINPTEWRFNTQFLEAAINCHAAGLSVLPARRDQKRPVLSGWKSFQKKLPTRNHIETWFSGDVDALCIVTGTVSGNLELIDFDFSAELFDAWSEQIPPELHQRLFIERSQSGGRHVVYRCKQPICGNLKLAQDCRDGKIVTLIETRGEGGLFLCHPTAGYEIEQGSLANLPVLTFDERDQLLAAAWQLNRVEDESRFASNIESVVDHTPRVSDVDLRPGDDYNQRGDVIQLLKSHGWTSGATLSDGNQHWTRPGKSNGTSATLKGRVFYVFSSNAAPLENGKSYSPFGLYAALQHNEDFETAARSLAETCFGSPIADIPPTPFETKLLSLSKIEFTEPTPPKQMADPGPLPEHLLRIPGFISEVMDHCLETAPYPNQVMAFCGALSLQAMLAGRRVRDPGDNRTNLYLLGLAHSAAGKDWPRKLNVRILQAIGMANCTGERFASGEGIQDSLYVTPSMMFQTDEIDGLLQSISRSKDARYEQIMSTLLTMYSSANSVYPMRRKAGKEAAGVINQPSLVIFGTAIPNHYYGALSERMLTNGLFARMLIFECGKRGSGQEPKIRDVPGSIIETAKWWENFRPGAGNLVEWNPKPAIVPQDNAAKQLLVESRINAENQYERAEEASDSVGTTVWGRVSEQTRKLALLHAISLNCRDPVVDATAARWAIEVVEHQARRMLFMAGDHVACNDFDAMAKAFTRQLRNWKLKHGDKPMPEWELTRRLPWKPSDHREVIKLLESQRLVTRESSSSRTKPGFVYRLAEN